MKAGKNLIPASRMATTKGLAAAFAALQRDHLVPVLHVYRSGVRLPLVGPGQGSRVGRDKQTNNKDSTNVEHQDSPEGTLDSPGDRPSRVSRLTNCIARKRTVSDSFQKKPNSRLTCDSDQLGTDIREKSVGNGIPDTKEDSDIVLVDVVSERSGLCKDGVAVSVRNSTIHPARLTLPVSETDPVVVGSTSEIEDDTQKQKTNEDQNLARGHPEFNLSEEGDTENVDDQDNNNDDRTEEAS